MKNIFDNNRSMKNAIELFKKNILPIFVFYLLLVATASLWPRLSKDYQTGEISTGQIPKEGDNFKIANNPIVYRLEAGKRRAYKSDQSFLNNSDNKPFDTPYAQGGILICDKETVLAFSIGNYMPKKIGGVGEVYLQKGILEQLKKSFFRKDKLKHFLAYMVLAILLLMALEEYSRQNRIIKYAFALVFGIVFGAVIEQLQFEFVLGRNKELLDLIFNILGVLMGIGVYNRWANIFRS